MGHYCVAFRAETKIILSSGNDGMVVCWGSVGGVVDKVLVSDTSTSQCIRSESFYNVL